MIIDKLPLVLNQIIEEYLAKQICTAEIWIKPRKSVPHVAKIKILILKSLADIGQPGFYARSKVYGNFSWRVFVMKSNSKYFPSGKICDIEVEFWRLYDDKQLPINCYLHNLHQFSANHQSKYLWSGVGLQCFESKHWKYDILGCLCYIRSISTPVERNNITHYRNAWQDIK